jgi:hypothetical protein
LDKFPGWSRVDVNTGWLRAQVNDQVAVDIRIKTDPERFWDHYQSSVLPKIHDHVMKVTENRPLPDKQPFHRDLDVEVWMSEPDFRLGIDEEQISSLESLHEDLYFVTLDFFDALGRTTTRRRLAAPGKIFPIVHPARPGQPGRVHVRYAGNASTKAKLDVTYREKGIEKPTRISRDLARIEASAPECVRAVVRADRVSELELQVEARDDREAARAADALDGLVKLQRAGLYKTDLSYEFVDRVAVNIGNKEVHTRRVVRSTGAARPSNVRTATSKPKVPVVAWDHGYQSRGIRRHHRSPRSIPRSSSLQGRALLSWTGDLCDGDHAPDVKRARVARHPDDAQAHDFDYGTAACERSVIHRPHPAAVGAARDGSDL